MLAKRDNLLLHAKQWLVFSKNIGKRLSINEASLSNGELYTILTNKSGKCRKGTIVAMVAGIKVDTVIAIIEKVPFLNKDKNEHFIGVRKTKTQ